MTSRLAADILFGQRGRRSIRARKIVEIGELAPTIESRLRAESGA